MIPREILKKIPQIGRRTNRIVTETLAGQYHSVFKGQGMNFDDVRAIDWNVTARMNHPFIKKFVEERELTLAQYGGAPFARNLETALGKISQLTGVKLSHAKATSSIKVVGAAKADLEHFDILDAAIKQRQPVEFAYRKLGEAEETKESRKVHPHHVACTKGRWYLAAYDLKRQAMRTFSLSRMEKLVVLKGQFERQPDFDPEKHFASGFGFLKGEGDYRVEIEFDRWGADLLQANTWHPSQKIKPLAQGRVRMSLQLDNLEEIINWLMSWGEHATVIAPEELRQRLWKIARTLVERYKSKPAASP